MFGENNPVHFKDLQTSLITLFQITTLEGWADIMYINVFGCDHPQWGSEYCPTPAASGVGAIVYFISFVLIGTMIVLNLFIGVIMNSMDEVANEQRMEALENDAKKAQAVIAKAKALSTSSLEGSVVSDNEERNSLTTS